MDAAITMAAVLAVVRPHMNGVGGDAFALILDASTGEVVALNGSGSAGSAGRPELFLDEGLSSIPETGPLSVSVPGAVSAWAEAHARFGTLPFGRLLAPAIEYAREGFPVSVRLQSDILAGAAGLDPAARAQYLPGGEPPPVGSLLRNVPLAGTLETIARDGATGFYSGPLARRTASFLQDRGGYLREEDLANHNAFWTDPLEADFRGHRILVLPPNSQGVALLQQLVMLDELEVEPATPLDADYLHFLLEIRKAAFADRDRWVADPMFSDVPVERLLARDYLASRARAVRSEQAGDLVESGLEEERRTGGGGSGQGERHGDGDTVYLTVVDEQGNAVSWIQSLFHSFGSGVMDPETGIVFHNRGSSFHLDLEHPNVIAPGKRPYHTLSPLLALTEEGDFAFTAGTPGGDGQTQTLVQVTAQLLLFGTRPQAAVEAPRFRGLSGLLVEVEERFPEATLRSLEDRGHRFRFVPGWDATFGGAQLIFREPLSGTLAVASDPRREAYGLAY